MDNYVELLKLILPEFLVEHFDLVKTTKQAEIMHLYFEERNVVPIEHQDLILVAHGFHNETTIQDFPLRGNSVYLHVKRRRWLEKESRKLVQRDWELVAKGTRMTTEFASFLKEINRY
ncbi:ISAon1 family transposase N-terminal region protein [Flavobacterium sp. JP2137]|uniref:ISAon1 family transposase N-terminal region protein n=1 Tax=Flavobacterium sp. JP2137 TaxID=3414510 RepID=UPI003D2FC316